MGILAVLEPKPADVGLAGRPECRQTGAGLGRGDGETGRVAGAAAVRRGEAGAERAPRQLRAGPLRAAALRYSSRKASRMQRVAAGFVKLSSLTGTEFVERCKNEIAARRTAQVELATYPRCGNITLSSTNQIAPFSPRARSGWADCEFGSTCGEPAAAFKLRCTPPWASVRSSVAHLPARALTRRPLFRPGQVFLGAFSVELPITARLLRLPDVYSVEHLYGASRCAAQCSTTRAAPLPARLTVGLLHSAAHLVWLKQNYNSVSQSHPTASAGACSA